MTELVVAKCFGIKARQIPLVKEFVPNFSVLKKVKFGVSTTKRRIQIDLGLCLLNNYYDQEHIQDFEFSFRKKSNLSPIST